MLQKMMVLIYNHRWQWYERILAVLLFLTTISNGYTQGEERILDYHTKIEVNTDRSILVTETIKIHAEGRVFRRGITRFLPSTRYLNDRLINVHYNIKSIEKDGRNEPYHSESQGRGSVLYIGQKEVFLRPGDYIYTIQYRVKDQIGFYNDYDEIYWNAIGTENQISCDRASAEVILPKGTEIIQHSAYLGKRGQGGQDFEIREKDNVLRYIVDRPLSPHEGFTVAVGFEKGVMPKPSFWDQMASLLILFLASIFLLPYYIYTWIKHGQDPPTPASYPLWESPDSLSPASINYIRKGTYQKKSFTASIIHLAIGGYLRIEEVERAGWLAKKSFKLIKESEASTDLPAEERQLLNDLFRSQNEVIIDGEYDSMIEDAYQAHRSSLSSQHSELIWKGNNGRLLILPGLVTLAAIILATIIMSNSSYGSPMNLTAMATFIPLALAGFGLYLWLIRRPAEKKLELRSQIKGFRTYLSLAEKDRLNLLNPPDMTPTHFEAMLPYAFALGVEHTWTQKFKSILDQMGYAPHWNNSRSMVYFSNNFGKDFGQSFAGAATPPSQSGSGSGGGGFSGGGGGGGGVGGW